jgi:iron complex outermembrane receptor protein
MKFLLAILLSIFIINSYSQKIDTINLNEVNVTAYSPFKANFLTPVTFKNITEADLQLKNYGQEPSIILNTSPSISSFSENGSPYGYSYIRMRGIDQTRINMTLNGVPMNEPEDQGVYFSNYPDFLQSVDILQIQRGSGMTKNGVSSYVGSINFESKKADSNELNFSLGYGSFNSYRISANGNKKWKNGGFYFQFSDISSEGYKYHSGNHGRSFFFSSDFKFKKNDFRIIGFAGSQYNQLAWLGVPKDSISLDRKTNANTTKENDEFAQYHLQFHHTYNINYNSKFNYSIYYNHLNGYYTFDNNNFYGIDKVGPIYKYDLNSNLIGTNINYAIKFKKIDFYLGLNGFTYSRRHIGSSDSISHLYTNTGYRNEISGYIKTNYNFYRKLSLYGDIQYRYTDFTYDGNVKLKYMYWDFINYNIGLNYNLGKGVFYYSFGKTNREPTRNDIFEGYDNLQSDSLGNPIYNDLLPESSLNHELGFRTRVKNVNFDFNFFYMTFKNEIVLNGQYGPTGIPLHNNVNNSTRQGFELNFQYKLNNGLNFSANMAYNEGRIEQGNNDITPILTPKWIDNVEVSYKHKWFFVGLDYRYQDFSYINFSNKDRIDAFYTLNGKVGLFWKTIELDCHINNITNQKYFTSGMVNNDTPLYFVGTPLNVYVNLKVKI